MLVDIIGLFLLLIIVINNMDNYLKRKNEELKLLSNFIDNNFQYAHLISPSNVISIKEQITKEIRNKNSTKYYHELTNKDRIGFNDIFEYNYTYERFNGFIKIPYFANDFYNIDKKIVTETYFSNCGMSSIVSLLSSIICSNDCSVDLMYEETYFETIKFLNSITKIKNKDNFLYIDSIASDFNFNDDINCNNYVGIIIDTTCFIGEDYKKVIAYIISTGTPCILVRSHTKIDLLATEYSHIGSVSFIYPKTENDKVILIQKIETDCRHLIGVFGACLPPEKFPTFLLSSEIKMLNNNRIKIVAENNNLFFSILNDNKINAILPNHKQFCLIYLQTITGTLEELKQKIYEFCKESEKDFITYPAVSFGFDYISIDCYQNFIDSTFKIRVCINDFPNFIVEDFTYKFIEFLKKIDN